MSEKLEELNSLVQSPTGDLAQSLRMEALDLWQTSSLNANRRTEVATGASTPDATDQGVKLYVGNLSYSTTSQDLQDVFSAHGTVVNAQVIIDRDTGRSKGFAFVQMASAAEAQAAIAAMNGRELNGRVLTVNEARPSAAPTRPAGGPVPSRPRY